MLGFARQQRRRRFGGGPAPADFRVFDDADFAAAHTAASPGQIIELADAGSFGVLSVAKSGITVRAQSRRAATVQALLVSAAQNVTLQQIRVRASVWPLPNNAKLIDLVGNVDGLLIDDLDLSCGYRVDNWAPFDVARDDYPEFGPVGGSGTLGGPPDNNEIRDHAAGVGTSSICYGSITCRDTDFADLFTGFKLSWSGRQGQTINFFANRLSHVYEDFFSIGYQDGGSAPGRITGLGNLLSDGFGCAQDNENPHADYWQFFPAIGYPWEIPGPLVMGNVAWCRAGARAASQRIICRAHGDINTYVGPRFIDNLMVSRVSNLGVLADLVTSAFIFRQTMLSHPQANVLSTREATANPYNNGGTAASVLSPTSIVVNTRAGSTAKHFADGNITEALSTSPNLAAAAIGNVGLGLGRPSSDASPNLFTGHFPMSEALWDALDSGEELIAGLTPLAAYQDHGAIRPGDTLASFLARHSDPDALDFSDIPSFVSFTNLTGQAVGTPVTSEWCFVHAHEIRAITVAGGEYRLADDLAGTGATSWTSVGGAVPHGKYVQLRQTSAATGSTASTASLTIGSQSFAWDVITESVESFPRVAFDGTVPDRFQTSSPSSLGADSKVITIALLDFKRAAPPAATERLFYTTAGTARVGVSVLTTGKLRIALYNAAGAEIVRFDTPAVCNNAARDILIKVDTSLPSTSGCTVAVDGSVSNPVPSPYVRDALIGHSFASLNYCVGGTTSTNSFTGELGALYVDPAAASAIEDAAVQAKFTADQLKLGWPTGAQPAVFQCGNAAEWASGDASNGVLVFLPDGSAAVADVGAGAAWD